MAGSEDSDSRDSGGGGVDLSSDAEGVWSPEIEQSFMEALAIYPPCGRRKVMLSHEGKMYGRNELIARYIKLRTGKTRTRKQVSSHLQVLSRRKEREKQMKLKQEHVGDKLSHTSVIPPPPTSSELPPPLRPPLAYAPTLFWPPPPPSVSQPGTSEDVKPLISQRLQLVQLSAFSDQSREDKIHRHLFVHLEGLPPYADPLLETVDIRQIHDKFPEKGGLKELYDRGPENAFYLIKFWADLNMNVQDEEGAFYGVNSEFESKENMTITCSTKVCSFGNIVVEKVKTGYARFEGGKFVYKIHNPMCEYMINFICKLRHLPEKYMMNSVLENFTILEVVTNRETQETLLCIAYVFEVSSSEFGAQHHVYRLARD